MRHDFLMKAGSMVFGGFQKLTVLDYPDKVACTLFTSGCNYACPFCHNASLILSAEDGGVGEQRDGGELSGMRGGYSFKGEDVLDFLRNRQGLLDGVCISGGEPLLADGLEGFVDEVKALGFLVKLDTNGSFPGKLERFINAGKIDYVAMDVKNSPEKYAQTIGVADYDISPVNDSIDLLLCGAVEYEFRTTVVREFHDENDLISIAQWISGAKKYFLQKFTCSPGVLNKGLHAYADADMRRLLSIVTKSLPIAKVRGI